MKRVFNKAKTVSVLKQFIPFVLPLLFVPVFYSFASPKSVDDGITYIDDPLKPITVYYDTVYSDIVMNIPDETFENVTKNTYKMSSQAHEFIKSFEQCRLTAYHIDGEKYNTIGWGHYLQKPEEQDMKHISQKEADELFRQDVAWVDNAVTAMLNDVNPKFKWPQGIVDGLGSLVYNCGEKGVRTTEFYRRLQNCRFHNGQINKSDIEYTLAIVKNTRCTMKGHYKRRAAEYEMMVNGYKELNI